LIKHRQRRFVKRNLEYGHLSHCRAADGYGLVGGVGEYKGSVHMAYVRGPEGIIVSLFEQIG
jgi:hypothetical protein